MSTAPALVGEPVRSPRMRGEDRREQLLDAAAGLVGRHGAAAMSMERLAAAAGVSKALPYKHFDNGDEVLAALYRRETAALGRAVWEALRAAPASADRARLAVRTYFEQLAARRPVLVALSHPGSTIPTLADPGQAGVAFEVELLTRFFDVDRTRAKAVAGMVQGAIVGAASTWLAGHGSRSRVEQELVALLRGVTAPAPG